MSTIESTQSKVSRVTGIRQVCRAQLPSARTVLGPSPLRTQAPPARRSRVCVYYYACAARGASSLCVRWLGTACA
eukprot:687107-Prymnesium_polylepis.1